MVIASRIWMLNHLEYSELSILQIGQTRSETQASLCTLIFSWGFLPSVSVIHLFLSCSNFTFLCGGFSMGTIWAYPTPTLGTFFVFGLSPSPHSAPHLFGVCPQSPPLAPPLFWVWPPVPILGTSFVLGLSPVPTLGTSCVLGLSPVPTLGKYLVCRELVCGGLVWGIGLGGVVVALDRCSGGVYNMYRWKLGLFCFRREQCFVYRRNSWCDLVKNCL